MSPVPLWPLLATDFVFGIFFCFYLQTYLSTDFSGIVVEYSYSNFLCPPRAVETGINSSEPHFHFQMIRFYVDFEFGDFFGDCAGAFNGVFWLRCRTAGSIVRHLAGKTLPSRDLV